MHIKKTGALYRLAYWHIDAPKRPKGRISVCKLVAHLIGSLMLICAWLFILTVLGGMVFTLCASVWELFHGTYLFIRAKPDNGLVLLEFVAIVCLVIALLGSCFIGYLRWSKSESGHVVRLYLSAKKQRLCSTIDIV